MRQIERGLLFLLFAYSSAGAQPPELTAAEAARIISESAAFREPERIELLIGGRVPANVTRPHYLLFEQAGLLRYSVQNAVAEVSLTDRGKESARGWTRSYQSSYNGSDLWHVPIGDRQLVGTPRVLKSASSRIEVEFEWRWVPNDIGRMLRLGGGPFRTRTILELRDGRYALLEAQDYSGLRSQLKASDASH